MDAKLKKAKELKAGDVILMKNTDLSYIPATVKSAEPYAKAESALVRESNGVIGETVISYKITVYGKIYEKKLIVPDTDIVLVGK
jgi:hypothetical protein